MLQGFTQNMVDTKPSKVQLRPNSDAPFKRHRRILFFVADLVFLVLAGIATTMAMHVIHMLAWPFVPTSLIGMLAAMLVQTVMAFAAAPLLGSIESMVPSMIVAMLSPMSICLLHLFGCESTWMVATATGSGFAIGTFALIRLYARTCAHTLMMPVQRRRG